MPLCFDSNLFFHIRIMVLLRPDRWRDRLSEGRNVFPEIRCFKTYICLGSNKLSGPKNKSTTRRIVLTLYISDIHLVVVLFGKEI